jgi:hypothetical protein
MFLRLLPFVQHVVLLLGQQQWRCCLIRHLIRVLLEVLRVLPEHPRGSTLSWSF